MGRWIVLSLCGLSLSLNVAAAPKDTFAGHYAVPTEHLKLLPKLSKPISVADNSRLSIVKMSEEQVEALAQAIHEKTGTCGGFMTVETELQSTTPEQLLMNLTDGPVARAETIPVQNAESVKKIFPLLNKGRYEGYIRNLSAFTNRSAKEDTGVQAADWIKDLMAKIARDGRRSDISIEMVPTPGFKQSSVIVKLPGQDSTLPAVLIGGHFDTLGASMMGSANKPGSDDDASGSAVAIEVFQALLQSKIQLKRDVYFAFYAAEELGLHGSKAVVAKFQQRKQAMRAVAQFDMTAFKSPNDKQSIFLFTDFTDATLTAFSKTLIETYISGATVGSDKCGYGCSDHVPWNKAGYPVIMPFETSMRNINKAIHTDADTMEKLDMDHAMQFVKLGAAFVVEAGESVSKK